ncbi:MAG: hypothetical protein Q4B16_05030 [Bacteroidia bacterium]|nr:hypothetical protein [Bacteroidia bacterium]
MKKMILIVAAISLLATAASAQKSIRVPHGYAAMIEQENTFHFSGSQTSIALSMTHGAYYSDNVYVGLGFGLEGNDDYTILPVFAATRYIFNGHAKVSPMFTARLGSYVGDDLGAYGEAGFGLRFASPSKFAFALSLVGKYVSGLEYCDYSSSSVCTVKENSLSGVGIRFSIEW